MATTEHARHRLYQRLNELIGTDEADTLMELLPPTGWADVATRHDLTHQSELMAARFEQVDARFEQVGARFEQVDARFEQLDDKIFARFTRLDHKIDARFTQLDDKIDARFTQLDDKIDAQAQIADHRLTTEIAGVRIELADLRTELHRSLRLHMLVIIGVLGTLITVVGAITSGA